MQNNPNLGIQVGLKNTEKHRPWSHNTNVIYSLSNWAWIGVTLAMMVAEKKKTRIMK